MNILLTNDDGIDGEGFLDFAAALRRQLAHRVFVIAPDANRSGVSHALTCLHGALALTRRGEDAWACSGSPADCAGIGVLGGLGQLCGIAGLRPDIVVSGINAGPNLGTDLLFSGTAAAARHAALYDIPAVALSLSAWPRAYHWDVAIDYAATHLEEFVARWRPDCFVNVNLPDSAAGPAGIADTFPCHRNYNDSVVISEDATGLSCAFHWGEPVVRPEPGSDCDAIARNLTSVSLIHIHPLAASDQGNEN